MKKIIIPLLLAVILFSAFTMHKYYLSLIKIEHNAKNSIVQVTMRIFIDDLQGVLNSTYDKDYELATPDEPHKKVDENITEYVQKMFAIEINGTSRAYTYIGKEYENDVVYLYIEVPEVDQVDLIKIKDQMLTEKFPEQKNIVKININDVKKTFFLTAEEDTDSLKF